MFRDNCSGFNNAAAAAAATAASGFIEEFGPVLLTNEITASNIGMSTGQGPDVIKCIEWAQVQDIGRAVKVEWVPQEAPATEPSSSEQPVQCCAWFRRR
jgi:hypothetical protein